MSELTRSILAIFAVIILSLALSGTKDGAKLVQAGLVIAIVVVVLKNGNAVQDAARNLTGLVTKSTGQPSSS
jgi:hypothetical protein